VLSNAPRASFAVAGNEHRSCMARVPSRNNRASPTRICAAVGVVPAPVHRASLALQLPRPRRSQTHSPLAPQCLPPRRVLFKASLPRRPLPLSLRASAPWKCVPIRAGFRPLVSPARGRGYCYAAADGMEQRTGKGARTKMDDDRVRDALHCRIWSRAVAIRERDLAVSAARRSAGVPTARGEKGPGRRQSPLCLWVLSPTPGPYTRERE
jgi:hypothetical protein